MLSQSTAFRAAAEEPITWFTMAVSVLAKASLKDVSRFSASAPMGSDVGTTTAVVWAAPLAPNASDALIIHVTTKSMEDNPWGNRAPSRYVIVLALRTEDACATD